MYYAERKVTGIDRPWFTVVHVPTIGYLATGGQRFFDADHPLEEQAFWESVSENIAAFE